MSDGIIHCNETYRLCFTLDVCQDISVNRDWLQAEWCLIPGGKMNVSVYHHIWPSLWPTQPPVHGADGDLSSG